MENENFEGYLAQSKSLIEKLSAPGVTLEESVKLYKEGMETIAKAQKLLQEASLEIVQMQEEKEEL